MRTTSVLASDTSVEAERIQVDLWRRMSPIEKLRTVTELKLGRQLACQVYPEAALVCDR